MIAFWSSNWSERSEARAEESTESIFHGLIVAAQHKASEKTINFMLMASEKTRAGCSAPRLRQGEI
jgi:hypothetical protein